MVTVTRIFGSLASVFRWGCVPHEGVMCQAYGSGGGEVRERAVFAAGMRLSEWQEQGEKAGT